jgi:hypothetical protein
MTLAHRTTFNIPVLAASGMSAHDDLAVQVRAWPEIAMRQHSDSGQTGNVEGGPRPHKRYLPDQDGSNRLECNDSTKYNPAMRTNATIGFLLALGVCAPVAAQRFEVPAAAGTRWYKGNTHTHTINTDGDSPPDTVVRWYKARGYNFLVISDHDTLTDPATLRQHMDPGFVLVPGEEVTGRFKGAPVHLTALNVTRIIRRLETSTLAGTLQANIDAVREGGAIPLINHPNYRWSLDQTVLEGTRNVNLFELYNGHPHTNNAGGGNSPSMEEVWDYLLTRGRRIYGVASDDSHHFKEWSRALVNPGRAWVWVKASRLDPNELVRNLEAGQFYGSTGVELEDVVVQPHTLEVRIKQQPPDFKYRTEFIGDGGRVLSLATGLVARYTLQPGVTYVRAKVTDSGGQVAWVQPVFVDKGSTGAR